jgi:hypothetical protein
MYGGAGSKNGNKARLSNFAQANEKLAKQVNKSPELASQLYMKKYRTRMIYLQKMLQRNY